MKRALIILAVVICAGIIVTHGAMAHGVAEKNQGFLGSQTGVHVIPFMYLGAKHMVTGYDHLLYLVGVVFYLTKFREIATFVSLFALGHSLTLLYGVLSGLMINPYLVDAVVGLSVSYKALENLKLINILNPKIAVFGFGLIHGFGLSTKLQDIQLSKDGLIANMISFNVGVEIGQLLALIVLLTLLRQIRSLPNFQGVSENINVALFAAGLILFGLHVTGFFVT